MNKVTRYFKGVGEEGRRVRWPHRKQLWTAVAKVMVITLISVLVIWFLDFLVSQIMKGVQEVNSQATSGSGTGSASLAKIIINYIIGGLFRW